MVKWIALFISAATLTAAVVTPSNTVLVADGDSQTARGDSWFYSLTNASTGAGFGATGWFLYTNTAASGQSSVEIDNGYTNQVRVYTNNYPSRVLVFTLNGGANDNMYGNTNRWLTNVLLHSNMIVRAKADNFLVLHFNLLVRDGYLNPTSPIGWSNETYRINWTNYNAWCASDQNPADFKMDWANLIPPSTLKDTNYWAEANPDELHLTLWANRVVATNVALLMTTNTGPTASVTSQSISGSAAFTGGILLR